MKYTYGYARVSTQSQELNRQLDILEKYQCDQIYTEKISGTKSSRPELNKLKDNVREGDTIVVESWSRLGRSTRDLIDLVEFFDKKKVNVISAKEKFDTSTPQGKLMLTVFQAFSEFEHDLIVQRTREGLKSARARGRVGGRPKKSEKKIKQALKLYDSKQYSLREIKEMSGVSTTTLYRYLEKRKSGD
ncbi:recombinase family protein [Enterococcus crotali]